MKKKLTVVVMVLLCFLNLNCFTASAATETVIKVEGPATIKKGDKIQYTIYIRDVSRLYAGSVDIKFDNKNINFKQIYAGDFIKKDGINKMEFGGTPNKDNNIISYQFTCTGKVDGFTGEGILATVIAEGIQDCEINLKYSLGIQICERTESNDIVDIKYSYDNTDVMSATGNNNVIGNISDSVNGIADSDINKNSETILQSDNSDKILANENANVDEVNGSDNEKDNESKDSRKYGYVIYMALMVVAVAVAVLVYKKKIKAKQRI